MLRLATVFTLSFITLSVFANPSTHMLAVVEENANHISFYHPEN
jgi:hypothetical protein